MYANMCPQCPHVTVESAEHQLRTFVTALAMQFIWHLCYPSTYVPLDFVLQVCICVPKA